MNLSQRIHAAADFLSARITQRPCVGMILGSGLGDFADTLTDRVVIPFSDIPDFPRATAEGHVGAFVFGTSQGIPVAVLQGRLHYYEGHSMQELTMPVRIMKLLGVQTMILTNASGGVNRDFDPGDLMLITDHINFSGDNPLMGPEMPEFGPRFADVSDLYTRALREKILAAADASGIALRQGVYMMFTGPNYETPAEVRMAQILGADAVGMSTAPEALVAGHCGMRVLGISCITNHAAGVTEAKLDHSEVVEVAAKVHNTFQKLLELALTMF